MRTVDAALTAALSAGNPIPYLKAYVGYDNGTVKNSHTNVVSYRLTGTSLEFVIPTDQNFASDQESIWLERGLTIAGTNYTVTTGRFFITDEEYLPNGWTRYKGSIFPHKYYSADGDLTYEQVIDAFCSEWGKSAVYKDDTEAWLDYQFLPADKQIIVNSAIRFLNLVQQKRLISCCDNGSEEVRFYSADVLGSADVTIAIKDEFGLNTTKTRRRQYVWRDENETVNYDGTATDPLHNLGYLESTDSPPARNTQTFEGGAWIRPDLRLQDGDVVKFTFDGGTKSVTVFAVVIEEFDAHSTRLPKWRMRVEANPIYHATEGGAMPSTIERVSNYTPLNTSNFDQVLSAADNNLQAAMETLDEHHPGGYVREVLGAARTYYVRKNVGTCTISNASPAVVTCAGHGLLDDDPVVFKTTGSLPTGLTPGVAYYVNYVDADTFQVAATADGASIATSSAGSGTHSVATGSDSNDGTAASRGSALLTIQAAINLAAALDSSIYNVTIQLADSHYIETLTCKNMVGAGSVTIQGDTATPSDVIIDGAFVHNSPPTIYLVKGYTALKSATSSIAHLQVGNNAQLQFSDIVFSTGWNRHVTAVTGGTIIIAGSYSITGGANYHMLADRDGTITNFTALTVTLTGTPAFAVAFAYATALALISLPASSVTYSGGATGQRYNGSLNSVINSSGGGANFFPGNVAGAVATGAQYG